MSKFAMIALYSVGFFLFLVTVIALFLVVHERVKLTDVFGVFAMGAVFFGLAAVIELLRKIAGKS